MNLPKTTVARMIKQFRPPETPPEEPSLASGNVSRPEEARNPQIGDPAARKISFWRNGRVKVSPLHVVGLRRPGRRYGMPSKKSIAVCTAWSPLGRPPAWGRSTLDHPWILSMTSIQADPMISTDEHSSRSYIDRTSRSKIFRSTADARPSGPSADGIAA